MSVECLIRCGSDIDLGLVRARREAETGTGRNVRGDF
jgi:hypothetical protein